MPIAFVVSLDDLPESSAAPYFGSGTFRQRVEYPSTGVTDGAIGVSELRFIPLFRANWAAQSG